MSEEFGNDYITLIDDDGVESEFEHIDTLEFNGETYIALVPAFDDAADSVEADGELVVLKVTADPESGEDLLVTIDDDAEYEEVGQMFLDRLDEMYDEEN